MSRLVVLLDAMILARGFAQRRVKGAASEILRLWQSGLFEIVVSGKLVGETAHTLRLLGVSDPSIEAFVAALCLRDRVVALQHQRMGCLDENDDHLLEAAIRGKAKIIVSDDKRGPLNLPLAAEESLRKEGVAVMSSAQFLRYLRDIAFSPFGLCRAVWPGQLTEPESFACALCGHRYHSDAPCGMVWQDAIGKPEECACFALSLYSGAT